MRDFTFTPIAFDQLNDWQSENGKTYQRITKLIKECARTPFDGTGKPEPLKGDLSGYCRAAEAVAQNNRRASFSV